MRSRHDAKPLTHTLTTHRHRQGRTGGRGQPVTVKRAAGAEALRASSELAALARAPRGDLGSSVLSLNLGPAVRAPRRAAQAARVPPRSGSGRLPSNQLPARGTVLPACCCRPAALRRPRPARACDSLNGVLSPACLKQSHQERAHSGCLGCGQDQALEEAVGPKRFLNLE